MNRESVERIVEAVGGKENISAATHCVTRLRLVLKDEGKVNQRMLDEHELVKGSFSTNGQFQVVIGQGTVDKVYKEMVALTGIGRSGSAALDLAYLACGRHEIFFELCLKPWDYAAGSLIVQEAGGKVMMPLAGEKL
ncbi:MAG: inositol monophosphatase family protein, partial [Priestia megaterium]